MSVVRSVYLVGIVGLALGCNMSAKIYHTEGADYAPLGPDCEVHLFRSADHLDGGCEHIGGLSLRDTGFSVDCASETVRREVRQAASGMGGNLAVLTRQPSAISTCVHSDAAIYRCPATDAGEAP